MDLMSIAVGIIAGGSIGYIAATIHNGARMDELELDLHVLRNEHETLYREYSRLTDRDERGRFKKSGE